LKKIHFCSCYQRLYRRL